MDLRGLLEHFPDRADCAAALYYLSIASEVSMQTAAFPELFPLFESVGAETLNHLAAIATEHEYPPGRAVLMEDSWGNAIYFLVSGWVKVRRLAGDNTITLAILGKGDFFGEMAILDESPRSTDVMALSRVSLLSISAQKFLQVLFKDPQLHHRMLQMMVRRLRQTNIRFQMRHQPPAVKLVYTLVALSEAYGKVTQTSTEIFNIPYDDLADVSDVRAEDIAKIMDKLSSKGWIKIEPETQTLHLINRTQLAQLAQRG